MKSMNRRQFIKGSIGAASLAAISTSKVRGANEKIIFGVMGIGGRGTFLADIFSQRKDVEIAYLCDPNTRRFARAREVVEENQDRRPKVLQDFRKMLEDKNVDVMINATPDHWHGLGSIMACQAGKDVYVEKPMVHNIFEGRKLIEASQKYKRVVQVGMQSRSAAYTQKARDYIQSGKLGKVHLVRVYNMMKHPFRKKGPDQPVPSGFDYDLWCGPAPKVPYNPSRSWLNMFDYSCGPIPGDAVHQIDLARFILGDPPAPKTVSHSGGIYVLKDGRDTPDTQMAAFEYDDCTFMLEAALWMPYMQKTPGSIRVSDKFPNFPFSSTKVEFFGAEGFMYYGRHGGGFQVYNNNSEMIHSEYGRPGDAEHAENFIQCIRNRKPAHANAEVGHDSVLLCHLANISYRVGNKQLEFDRQKERFTNCDEANHYIKRQYREPFTVPDQV